jgi:hypothetical protein
MSTPHLDESKAKAFAERLLGDLRGASVTLMVSVGTAPACSTRWRA